MLELGSIAGHAQPFAEHPVAAVVNLIGDHRPGEAAPHVEDCSEIRVATPYLSNPVAVQLWRLRELE